MTDFLFSFRILLQVFHEYKWKIGLLAFLGFLTSILASVGIGAVIPLLSFFVAGDDSGAIGGVSKTITKYFEYLPFELSPVSVIAIIVAVFLLRAGLLFLLNIIDISIRTQYRYSVKERILEKLLGARWQFFVGQKFGHVTDTFRDVDITSKLLGDAANLVLSLSNVFVLAVFAFLVSPAITVFALALGVVAILFFQKTWRKGRTIGDLLNVLNKETSQFVAEHVIGAKTVKSLAAERSVLSGGTGYFRKADDLLFKSGILSATYSVSTEPLTILFVAGVFSFFYFTSSFNLGVFAAVLLFIQRIFVYMGSAQLSFHTINEKIASAVHVLEFEKAVSVNLEKADGKKPFFFRDSLSFENVEFGYVSGINVFSGINFSVKKGEMVGVVGPSGSGKTTVADLSMRLVEPIRGRVLLDGVLASEYDLNSWRVNMGYVSQEPFLLNDTIELNIRFYGKNIDGKTIIDATKKAQIYDFVASQPQKFNTVVGDRGAMISGGQRQRIALARVLARNPQVLILDEATSSLDNESDALIQKAIRELKGQMTILMIAHRLSTVVDLDRILVLDKGKIIEEGKPQELLQDKNSYFYKMYHLKEN